MRAYSLFLGLMISASLGACSSNPSSTQDAREAERVAQEDEALTAAMMPGVDETALDRAVDPCQDFYAFSCNNYIKSLPDNTRSEVRGFSELRRERTALLAQLFTDIQTTPRNDAERKAATLYTGCLDGDAAKLSTFAAGVRADIAAITTAADVGRVVARLHRASVPAFFGFAPTADTLRHGRHGSALAYPEGFDWNTDYADADQRASRVEWLVSLAQQFDPTLGDADARAMATAAVNVEQALSTSAWNTNAAAAPLGRAGLAQLAPSFPWSAYFSSLDVSHLGKFEVDQSDYFTALGGTFATLSIADARAYLTTYFYDHVTQDSSVAPAGRAAYCQSTIAWLAQDAVEPRFLDMAGVDELSRRKARALFNAIADAFDERLRGEEFLTGSTRD